MQSFMLKVRAFLKFFIDSYIISTIPDAQEAKEQVTKLQCDKFKLQDRVTTMKENNLVLKGHVKYFEERAKMFEEILKASRSEYEWFAGEVHNACRKLSDGLGVEDQGAVEQAAEEAGEMLVNAHHSIDACFFYPNSAAD